MYHTQCPIQRTSQREDVCIDDYQGGVWHSHTMWANNKLILPLVQTRGYVLLQGHGSRDHTVSERDLCAMLKPDR